MIDAPESRKSSEPICMGKPFAFGRAPCSCPVPVRSDVSLAKPLPPTNAGDELVRVRGTSNVVGSSAKFAFDMATELDQGGPLSSDDASIRRGI